MEYRIRTLEEAIQDVQEAIDWYSDISIDLSTDIEAKFYFAVNKITKSPLLYPKDIRGYRKYKIPKFPYNLIFKIKRDLLIIVAFAHHKRKPNYWKKRS